MFIFIRLSFFMVQKFASHTRLSPFFSKKKEGKLVLCIKLPFVKRRERQRVGVSRCTHAWHQQFPLHIDHNTFQASAWMVWKMLYGLLTSFHSSAAPTLCCETFGSFSEGIIDIAILCTRLSSKKKFMHHCSHTHSAQSTSPSWKRSAVFRSINERNVKCVEH